MLNDSALKLSSEAYTIGDLILHICYVMLVSPYRMLHYVRVLLGWAQNSDLGSVYMEVGDLR